MNAVQDYPANCSIKLVTPIALVIVLNLDILKESHIHSAEKSNHIYHFRQDNATSH